MRSTPLIYCVLLVLALPCTARTSDGQPLAPVDFAKELFRARHQQLGVVEHVRSDDAYWGHRLLRQGPLPSDAYTDVAEWDGSLGDTAWRHALWVVSTPNAPVSDAMALRILQWDMGYTKALPGRDIALGESHGYRNALVAANALKAGVDADIFWQALAIFGNRHSTVAAKIAVAAQILRDQAARHGADRDAVMNIRRDVLGRFMAIDAGGTMDDYDMHYLTRLLDDETGRYAAAWPSSSGDRQIPTPYRVARTAAAYRHAQGFVTAPCNDRGNRIPHIASSDTASGAAMCFTDAHDRAVFDWYKAEFRRQATAVRDTPHHTNGIGLLLGLLAPFGALLDVMAVAEFSEALMADDLLEAEELTEDEASLYEDRLNTLTCRAP